MNTPAAEASTPVYCLSGLGADERAFARMELPPGYHAVNLPWIRPKCGEGIEQYAGRMASTIDTTRPFILLGMSFGGVVAQQIAKIHEPEKLILISSLQSPKAVRGVFGFISRSRLYTVMPFGLVTIPNKFSYEAFGAKDDATKKLLAGILRDTDVWFFRWAAGRMTRWEPYSGPVPVYEVHGSADRIIPIDAVKPDRIVQGAGHLMIFDHAKEVNEALRVFLES